MQLKIENTCENCNGKYYNIMEFCNDCHNFDLWFKENFNPEDPKSYAISKSL